jgi:hypothetical protein
MAKVKLSAFDRLRLGARLNRKERRDVEQRLSATDPGLEIVNRDAAGIDVGNEICPASGGRSAGPEAQACLAMYSSQPITSPYPSVNHSTSAS